MYPGSSFLQEVSSGKDTKMEVLGTCMMYGQKLPTLIFREVMIGAVVNMKAQLLQW